MPSTIALICAIYAFIGFALYRQRAMTTATWVDSDLVVFAAPAVVAFVAVWVAATNTRRRVSYGPIKSALVAFVSVALSFLSYMLIAVNLYGV